MTALDAALVARCREIMTTHARSFTRAAAFLPPVTRDRVAVLYAFCRVVDDAVDEAPDARVAAARIGTIREELRVATGAAPATAEPASVGDVGWDGEPPAPILRAFALLTMRDPVAAEAALALLDGVASDLGRVRVADDRELLRYCYRVAGTVGLMMCDVLGVDDPRALPHAIDLGVAMQLTNICRDVLEDAGRDRVYLPATRLRSAGTDPEALVAGVAPREAVRRVVRDLLALADRYYASGDDGVRFIPPIPRQAILVASRLYRGIGTRLRHRHGGDALHGRTIVPPGSKIALIGAALATNLLPRRARHHDGALHRPLTGLPGTASD